VTDPIEQLQRKLLMDELVPFEWAIAYPDNDAVARAWRACRNARALETVLAAVDPRATVGAVIASVPERTGRYTSSAGIWFRAARDCLQSYVDGAQVGDMPRSPTGMTYEQNIYHKAFWSAWLLATSCTAWVTFECPGHTRLVPRLHDHPPTLKQLLEFGR